jgi:3-oxoacyl-[acyl-carrier-protein] synthase-3
MALARRLGLAPGRVYLQNVPRLGHCFGADPFINARDAIAEGRIGEGARVLLVSVGMGMSATTVLARVAAPTDNDNQQGARVSWLFPMA